MSFLWYWPQGGWDFDAWKKAQRWAPVHSEQSGKREALPLVKPGMTLADWAGEARRWRDVSNQLLGKLTDRAPAKVQWEWLGDELLQIQAPSNTMRRLRYRLTEDEWGYAWLLSPSASDPGKPLPAIIALHQTHPHGKSEPVGLEDVPETSNSGLRYGVELAQRGYVVLAPDAIAFGERQAGHLNAKYRSADAFFAAHPEGSVMGKMGYDTSRAVDLLEQFPHVDATRIGCVGHSHGAYGTLFAMLAEPRIKAGVISCGLNLLREDPSPHRWWRLTALIPRLGFYENQMEQTPLDFHHWLALLSPRPVMVIAGDQDAIFPNCRKLRPGLEKVGEVYELHGARGQFRGRIYNGPHNFPADLKREAWEMLDAALKQKNRQASTNAAIGTAAVLAAAKLGENMTPSTRTFRVPDTRLPFVNGEIAQVNFQGQPHLVSGVWASEAGGRFYLWNPLTKSHAMRMLPAGVPGAYMFKTGPDGRLYIGDGKGDLHRYDPASDKVETLVTGKMHGITWGGCVTDRYVTWTANPGDAVVYDWRENKVVKVFSPVDSEEPHAHYGHNVLAAPDGKILLFMDVPQMRICVLDPKDISMRSVTPKSLVGQGSALQATFFDPQTLFVVTGDPGRGFQFLSYPDFELKQIVEPPKGYQAAYGRGCKMGDYFYAHFGPPTGSLWRISNATRKWEQLVPGWLGEDTGYLGAFEGHTIGAITVAGTALSWDSRTGKTDSMEVGNTGQLNPHAFCVGPERNIIVGAPFINARFWTIDMSTGEGRDGGRGMPGAGQVNQIVWDAGRHVALLSAYTEAAITEYDPGKPAGWPTNPRLVASAKKENQMRPRALEFDRRYVWMATGPNYGQLGGALSRIDPQKSEIKVWRNIVPDQTINALVLDLPRRRVYLSSEIYADCDSCPPTQKTAQVACFDMDKLEVIHRLEAPGGIGSVGVTCMLPDGRLLLHEEKKFYAWDADAGRVDALGSLASYGPVVKDKDGVLWSTVGGAVGVLAVGPKSIAFTPVIPHKGGSLHLVEDTLYYAIHANIYATPLDDLRSALRAK